MALETGTFISDLVETNPVSTDGLAQTDDHLRLIKSTLKATFPNITGTLTVTQDELNTLDGITSSTAELNKLDGYTGTAADLNYAASLNATGVTADEFNVLDGITSTTAELNKLDGFTGSVDDLNYLAELRATGVTATEFDKLDGYTGTYLDLNYAKDLRATGVTSTEFDYLDGVTSNIQTQLNSKAAKAVTVSAGSGLSGGGDLSANRTISHADTSSVSSVNNSGNTYIQDLTFDAFGHVTGVSSGTVSIPTYQGWDLYVNGTKQDDITENERVGFDQGNGITVSYDGNDVTITHGNTSNLNGIYGTTNGAANYYLHYIDVDSNGHVTNVGGSYINFGTGNAGLATGAVGTYVFAVRNVGGSKIAYGSNYSGSELYPNGIRTTGGWQEAYRAGPFAPATLSGTWKALGNVDNNSAIWPVTLFIRIA